MISIRSKQTIMHLAYFVQRDQQNNRKALNRSQSSILKWLFRCKWRRGFLNSLKIGMERGPISSRLYHFFSRCCLTVVHSLARTEGIVSYAGQGAWQFALTWPIERSKFVMEFTILITDKGEKIHDVLQVTKSGRHLGPVYMVSGSRDNPSPELPWAR